MVVSATKMAADIQEKGDCKAGAKRKGKSKGRAKGMTRRSQSLAFCLLSSTNSTDFLFQKGQNVHSRA